MMKKFEVTIRQVATYRKTTYAHSEDEAIAKVRGFIRDGSLSPCDKANVGVYTQEKKPRYVVRTNQRLGLLGVGLEGDAGIIAKFDHEEDAQAFAKLKNEMEGL